MVTLRWYKETFTADKAVRKDDSIILYDENNREIQRIVHISVNDWKHITLDGTWTNALDIPTDEERINSLMMQNEQQQADIDYCLMLLEE